MPPTAFIIGWMARRGEYGADAFGRCVGISRFAFCTACGQPRKLLRSSSGAKSAGRQPRARFEPDDVEPGLRERQRGHAAGGAEADDDDVGPRQLSRHVSARSCPGSLGRAAPENIE